MYDVSILINRAAELGWLPFRVFHEIEKLPKKERISSASVYRVFELRRGRPETLTSIAKVLGFQLKDLVVRVSPDLPVPADEMAERELVAAVRSRTSARTSLNR